MTDIHLGAASPWAVDTAATGLTKHAGPGHAHPLTLTAPAPDDVVSGVLTVPAVAEITVTGLLESVAEGVVASGTATATAEGACSRCLREIAVRVEADFLELYAYPDSPTAQTTDPDEVPRIVDDVIDLRPLIHDELVLAMPTIPLCEPDCPGLCADCGERLDRVGPDHRHDTMDPRWAALADMLPPGHAGRGDATTARNDIEE